MGKRKASKIVFVCQGKKCKKLGGKKIYKNLKHSQACFLSEHNLSLAKSSCLDQCKKGPNIYYAEKIMTVEEFGNEMGIGLAGD